VLERFAELTRHGGYLGASALVQGAAGGDLYLDALSYVFRNQEGLKQSHVHQMIQKSIRGEFGPDGPAGGVLDRPRQAPISGSRL
jgi:hypothetical protein